MLDDGVARGRRDRNAYLLESWAQYGSLLRLAAGRLADARAEAESYETIFKEAAAANFTAMAGVVALAEVATRTGDRKLLKAVVDVARRMPTDSTPLVKRYGDWILTLAAVLRNDPGEAARRLRGDYPPYASPFLPGDAAHPPAVAPDRARGGGPGARRGRGRRGRVVCPPERRGAAGHRGRRAHAQPCGS